MAEDPSEMIAEGKLDLVPMIDCIMLLLLFFILTTKFTADEKAIASLLPTDKGQAPTPSTKPVEPPKTINVCIYPEGLVKGFQPSEYQAKYEALKKTVGDVLPTAYLRMGGDEAVVLDGNSFSKKAHPDLKKNLDMVHQYIHQQLAQRENAAVASRKEQDPVIIHCFSGMSWKFALVAYDAVRDYEGTKMGSKMANDPSQWDNAREVSFAPPRIRNYSARELGSELYEIVNMQ
jgi:biopolymer transport protein ExbD